MLKRLSDWVDDRTGYRKVVHEALEEPIPGGARWRYVFGSALTATFLVQLVTGLLLMTAYSPSATTAWGSVFYINNVMTGGWFIRGIHHFGSQAMIVLLGLHMLQVLLAGAYRAPREFNWWFGMLLLFLTLGLGLTGYLLPWDQKGYWATKVATNIAGGMPGLGPYIQKIIVGGSDYGNQTLTRFYGLHVGILPGLLVLLLVIHVALFRKHGVTHPAQTRGVVDPFWPKQVFYDTVASLVAFGVIVGLVLWERGANLDAPADPSSSDYPARPEWYFLSLFQLLKAFPGEMEILGTVVVPTAILVVLMLLPLFDRVLPRRAAHFLACAIVFALVGGAGYLTVAALMEDARNPKFQADRRAADELRARAIFLAEHPQGGIGPEGAGYLLRRDPYTNGRRVLESRCLSCHYYDGRGQVNLVTFVVPQDERNPAGSAATPLADEPSWVASLVKAKVPDFTPQKVEQTRGTGPVAAYRYDGTTPDGDRAAVHVRDGGGLIEVETHSKQTASDLKGFGSKAWVRGLLEDPASPTYFGANPNLKGMKTWKAGQGKDYTAEQLDTLADFVALLGAVPPGQDFDRWLDQSGEQVTEHPGYQLFVDDCGKCHVIGRAGEITEGGLMDAPNLFAYGSRRWIEGMVRNPADEHYYGYLEPTDQMPPFERQLSENDMDTLIRYLQGDYIPPPGQGVAEARPAGEGAR